MNAPFKSIVRPFFRMPWTDERIAKLTELHGLGLSASRIAAQLGDVTRNGIIGKLHRLGLKRDAKPVRVKLRRRRPSKPKSFAKPAEAVPSLPASLKARGMSKLSTKPVANPHPVAEPEQAHPSGFICTDDTSIPISDLVDGVCHWPFDIPDEPVRYCGVKSVLGAFWCEQHARRVWQQRERA